MFKNLACVSVAVRNLDECMERYRDQLGFSVMSEIKESQRGFGLRWVEIGHGEHSFLELIEASGPGPIDTFLSRHGEGVYQVRLLVDDLDATLNELESRGARVIRDRSQVPGASRLGWIHPTSTGGVLFELIEQSDQERSEKVQP